MIPDILYRTIARQIRDGSCVLFLGPAAIAARQPDGSYRPLVEMCANELAQGLGLAPDEANALSHVASTLRVRKILAETMIISQVQQFYARAEREAALHPLVEQLADLPFRLIINTTPDDFFARYFAQAVRDFRFDYYNFRKPAPDPLYAFNENDPPLVYNLFGFYKKPESLVLTYGDQLGYVNKITGAQHERLPDSLLAAFNGPRVYLFLGFDFEDWSLRILLDSLFKNNRTSIQPFAYPLKGDRIAGPYAKVFFQSEFRMEFPEVDFETFAGNLLQHYHNLDQEDAEMPAGQPSAQVLLLHNDATDGDAADALLAQLRPLKVKSFTVRDAIGEGDVTEWIRKKLDECQVVLPVVTADFFAPDNPALPLLDELVRRNNPRARFLVMPVLARPCALEGTALGTLKTIRPTGKMAVFGEGQENKHLADIAETLKRYLETF